MIRAKRFDGVTREFERPSEAVAWADSPDGLRDWMQDGDYITHTGIPGKCGNLVVVNAEGEDTDAHIQWWREDDGREDSTTA